MYGPSTSNDGYHWPRPTWSHHGPGCLVFVKLGLTWSDFISLNGWSERHPPIIAPILGTSAMILTQMDRWTSRKKMNNWYLSRRPCARCFFIAESDLGILSYHCGCWRRNGKASNLKWFMTTCDRHRWIQSQSTRTYWDFLEDHFLPWHIIDSNCYAYSK